MTEKEKMLAGELYTLDSELKKELIKAKELCQIYNLLKPSQIEERKEIIRKTFEKNRKKFLD